MDKDRKLYITKAWVVIIFIYYVAVFALGSYVSFEILLSSENPDVKILSNAIIGSVAIALTASSIAYIRKLYKLCFSYSSEQEEEDQLFLKRLGTIVYFITRPIFALAFSLLVVATLKVTLIVSSSDGKELNSGFIYICMITSFYVGFLSGDFIKKLEEKGASKFKKIV